MIFRPAILYIDDEQANLDTFRRAFGSIYLVKTCLSGFEALQILEKEFFPLVIADQRMPGMTGIELCEKLVELYPNTLRMILTAYSEPDLLLKAINRGRVHDYIVKPWRKSELLPILEKAFDDYKKKTAKLEELEGRSKEADLLKEEIRQVYNVPHLIGSEGGLAPVLEILRKAAPTDATLLLLGETGVGKELMARSIHEWSLRKNKPFVPVHCGALAKSVIESELFGHEKGAFTGADQTRIGRFEQAQGGTLFLDEIGEISEEVQVKLLRVFQERQIQRVGGNKSISVDIRLVAATHKHLGQEVSDGKFRADLYYRLNVIPITLPSLRERKEDILPLADYFLKKYNFQMGRDLVLSSKASVLLQAYDWPGNVRELQNILERAVILCPGQEIDAEDLHLNVEEIFRTERIDLSQLAKRIPVREQIQQQEVLKLTQVLHQANGNLSEAARLLGIARSTLFYRLKKHGLL